ncbi:flagellar hook-length control protein FliK [Bradyrhizobium sp. Arg68]|uniref:flagellar hook-length control protein FliK n=1 Tax=Bradyrhizobium ivorense TaxID=2511166 RepID=UPI001E373791|nr:flagellar hook-length control protein FliK [Bradyrhizobium ivorense]MCC8938232.1 flagellar hook-length control protein FliK [Bradyrhizobium ivorense]
MTKLSGTSGQLFSATAETFSRGSRAGTGAAKQATGDKSFQDLIHTVSNQAKRTSDDQDKAVSLKPVALRTRIAELAERDEPRDEPVREQPETAEERHTSPASPTRDHAATLDVPSRLTQPSIVGQELAAAPLVKPQAQPQPAARDKATPDRAERSSTAHDLPATRAPTAANADVVDAGSRPPVDAPRPAASPQADATPKAAPAVSGFETVAANVGRAAKVSAREALPEATKVTVVQQETHLPPLQQFTAPQQVANAVVAELEGAAQPAPAAAPDLASSQSNTPDQPLKILTISLEPPDLGNVTVRLRLVGEAVSVHLAADRKDTSQMLDQQRDSIRELMQSAGYVADVAPVRHGSLDGFQAGSNQSQASFAGQQQSSQPQGGPGGSGTSSGQPQDGAKQPRQEHQNHRETRHDQDVALRDRRGAVYL